MKKIRLIIVAALLLSLFTVATATTFTDVNNHWAKEYIEDLQGKEIVSGDPDGSFRPDDNIKIIEYLVMTTRAMGNHIPVAKKGYWGQNYIDFAIDNSLIKPNDFKDYNRKITREEMAYIITNAVTMTKDVSYEDSLILKIGDYTTIDSKYIEGVLSAYETGIISGYPDGSFKAKGKATRAETCVVISRFLAYMDIEDTGDKEEPQKPQEPTTIDITQEFIDKHVKARELKYGLTIEDNKVVAKGYKPKGTLISDIDHKIKAFIKNTVGYGRYSHVHYLGDDPDRLFLKYSYNSGFDNNGNYDFAFMLRDETPFNEQESAMDERFSSEVDLSLYIQGLIEVDGSTVGDFEPKIWQPLENTIIDMFPTYGKEIAQLVKETYTKRIHMSLDEAQEALVETIYYGEDIRLDINCPRELSFHFSFK